MREWLMHTPMTIENKQILSFSKPTKKDPINFLQITTSENYFYDIEVECENSDIANELLNNGWINVSSNHYAQENIQDKSQLREIITLLTKHTELSDISDKLFVVFGIEKTAAEVYGEILALAQDQLPFALSKAKLYQHEKNTSDALWVLAEHVRENNNLETARQMYKSIPDNHPRRNDAEIMMIRVIELILAKMDKNRFQFGYVRELQEEKMRYSRKHPQAATNTVIEQFHKLCDVDAAETSIQNIDSKSKTESVLAGAKAIYMMQQHGEIDPIFMMKPGK